MSTITFFDTTCRDGKQAPGNHHSANDTVALAHQAAKLGINVFEAGFAAASETDHTSINQAAREVAGMTICSLARTNPEDIEAAATALDGAIVEPRIHIFIATSDLHLIEKLHLTRDEALAATDTAVTLAKRYTDDVQWSAEDATRSDFTYLVECVRTAVLAGATTINLPDTVGYATPEEMAHLIRMIKVAVPELVQNNVTLSVHCHNDLGLATANTLAGIQAGATQVECTINGIGERAGNTHYAEVAMALKTRADYFHITHSINSVEIGPTARQLSSIIGKPIPDTIPIVGGNVFAHAAGIHQHGVIKNPATYEIMSPEAVGWCGESLPLSAQSGKHGLKARLEMLGISISPNQLPEMYVQFLHVAERETLVSNDMLRELFG